MQRVSKWKGTRRVGIVSDPKAWSKATKTIRSRADTLIAIGYGVISHNLSYDPISKGQVPT